MFESMIAFNSSSFFTFGFSLHQVKSRQLTKSHRLPRLDEWMGEEGVCEVYLGWSVDGLALKVACADGTLLEEGTFELMIDTRDVKNASATHRFCHHFSFNCEEGREVTRFRSEDAHPLCDPTLLELECKKKEMVVWIPKEALVGYEPSSFDRMGLAYQLSAQGEILQQLPLSSRDVVLDKHPGRWAAAHLAE